MLLRPDLAGKWISPMHPEHVHDGPANCPVCGMAMVPAEKFGFAKEAPVNPGVITVPRNAILFIGNTSAVYVQGPSNEFTIRKIVTGSTTSLGRIHVVKGLEAGETIATAGVFLLDSQMQLNGQTSLIDLSRDQQLNRVKLIALRKTECLKKQFNPDATSCTISAGNSWSIDFWYRFFLQDQRKCDPGYWAKSSDRAYKMGGTVTKRY